MENELIKIKEDAIKIQELDIADTIRSIENENTKASFALGFSATFLSVAISSIDGVPIIVYGIALVFLLVSIVCSLYNITSKKIKTHTSVDEIFVHNSPTQWEDYLNNKHLRLRNAYQEAKELLYNKTALTRWAFIFLILSTTTIAITKIIL